jgi:hypothetical protein
MIDKTVPGTTIGTTIGNLFVKMDTTAFITDVSVTPSNYTNGALCSYLVSIVTPYSIMTGDQITMTY